MAAAAASDEDEEEEEEESGSEPQSSSSGSDSDSRVSSDEHSSSDDDDDDESDEEDDDGEESDGDEQQKAAAARERVRADVVELQRMADEMEKVRTRLQFRLEREKQARVEAAQWQQQQQQLKAVEGAERDAQAQLQREQLEQQWQQQQHRQRQQAAKEDMEQDRRESMRSNGRTNETSKQREQVPEPLVRPAVDIGVQTDRDDAPAQLPDEHSHHTSSAARASRSRRSAPLIESSRAPHFESTRRSTPVVAPASVNQSSARLSLFDLGKSYGMDERRGESRAQRESLRGRREDAADMLVPAAEAGEEAPSPTPLSDESDSETFFIRRDSARTSWQPERARSSRSRHQPSESFRRSRGGISESDDEFIDDNDATFATEQRRPESPESTESERVTAHAHKSALQTLRSSILSSIHEASSGAVSLQSSRASLQSPAKGECSKSDEQREHEAVRSLLFGR